MTDWKYADLALFTGLILWCMLLIANFVIAIAIAVIVYALIKRLLG